ASSTRSSSSTGCPRRRRSCSTCASRTQPGSSTTARGWARCGRTSPGSKRCCASARSRPPSRWRPSRRRKMPEATDERQNRRKVREGIVVSTKMDKTVVVAVVDRVRHRRYGKTLQRTRRLYAHDDANDAREGDRVRLRETGPLSRQKRWRVVEVLERAK